MLSAKYLRIEDQFKHLPQETRLVILHPAAYSDHRLFAQFLLRSQAAIYVHLLITTSDMDVIAQEIANAIQEQAGVTVPALKANDPGRTLAEALNSVPDSLLFLEGYDGELVHTLRNLMASMVSSLAEGHKIVLSGRRMPANLLNMPGNRVAMIPIDQARLLVDYAHPEAGKTFLEVRSFGQGQVLVNGEPVLKWEGLLPRDLFFFLVDRAMTTRDEIFRTFWPKLPSREATNVFHVTKRKISEILQVNLTVYGAGFYRVAPDINLHYDVVNFQEAVQNAAIEDDDKAEELYRIAIDLYREEFLSPVNQEWAVRRREEMRITYTDALIGLARICEHRDDKRQALGLFQRASGVAPTREDLTRSMMRLYDQLDQPDLAMEAYARLEETLKKSFGVKPDPQTIQVMEQIRKRMKR